MDKTFIKTSDGIIRLEHISHIAEYEHSTEDYSIIIYLTNGNDINLEGKEARSFLQFIPITIDLSYLVKEEESGVQIAGIKM